MSDSLFQVAGVSSGIAWDEIINKILETGKKPATQWQKQIDTLEVKKTLYQELQSNFNKLRNSMTPLRLASAYKSKKAEYTSFSDNNAKPENIVNAKISADAELTWWDLEVKELARAQRHMTTRFTSVSEALGIAGEFRVRVGKQCATIKIEASDNLREINYKLSNAKDQDGNGIAVTAKILDNRIVLESATAGKGSSGATRGTSFTMGGGGEYYLPHSANRDSATGKYSYPQQLFQVCYKDTNVDGSTYTYNYKEGVDFTYDANLGKITWLGGTSARKPPRGAEFEVIYSEWLNSSDTSTFADPNNPSGPPINLSSAIPPGDYNILPFLPTGQPYKDLANRRFEIVGSDGTEYVQGVDFQAATVSISGVDYQVVEWLTGGGRPAANSNYTIRIGAEDNYAYDENVFYLEPAEKVTSAPVSIIPTVPPGAAPIPQTPPGTYTGAAYIPSSLASLPGRIKIDDGNGHVYVEGVDYVIGTASDGINPASDAILWIGTPPSSQITFSRVIDSDYGADSVLAKLGFITADAYDNDKWRFTDGTYANASDAVFELDGVEVTRSSNTVSDLIANVTLELRGLGKVRINVVRDLETTVENIEKFVEEYNNVMEWINFYVSQKQDAANQVNEDDHLSSILQQSKGNTVFGALHGDQLLWSIKNQLRKRVSDPLTTLATSLTSRKVADTTLAMQIKTAFYIYVGGKAAKITIEPSDSMEDVRRKISDARNIVSNNGSASAGGMGGTLGLNVSIRNGQLVLEGTKDMSSQYTTGDIETTTTTIKRGAGTTGDYLSFIPITQQPVDGKLQVFSGASPYTEGRSTMYTEGIDYRLVTSTENNVVSSRIEWLNGKGPSPNSNYNISYSYHPNAVYFSEVPGSGPTNNELGRGLNGFSYLELHQDASKSSMSSFGFTTDSAEHGKSGLLDFDSEKFLAMIDSDPTISANTMLTFMRDFDTYIGNLVDSSQTLVAGQVVTKGRIAGALNKIDLEQQTLNDRIAKLEKDLETKQTALYKQYSDMEVAIQKLNAQMSSIANFLNSSSNNNK